jgi:hypothetical protein
MFPSMLITTPDQDDIARCGQAPDIFVLACGKRHELESFAWKVGSIRLHEKLREWLDR